MSSLPTIAVLGLAAYAMGLVPRIGGKVVVEFAPRRTKWIDRSTLVGSRQFERDSHPFDEKTTTGDFQQGAKERQLTGGKVVVYAPTQ